MKMPLRIGGTRCRSCNRRTISFDKWIRVVCDSKLEHICASRKLLEALQRSVVGNRALTWTSTGTIVGRLLDPAIRIFEEMNCFPSSSGFDVAGMMDKEVDPILWSMTVVLGDEKTFAVTEHSLGSVPQATQEGGIVCILLDCSVPVILRPGTTSSRFHYVGRCYIHGLMEGMSMQVVSERIVGAG